MKFTFEADVPVRPPFRLDLTAQALRRLAGNRVDHFEEAGVYRRALCDALGSNVIEVRQSSEDTLHVRVAGPRPDARLELVERMLGTMVDLAQWESRVAPFAWLRRLAQHLRGLKPPRYASIWEALAHAIVFQQISIAAAASIMGRTVEVLATPLELGGTPYYPFFSERRLLDADERDLRAAGLSANKIAHLRAAALAVLHGEIGNGLQSLSSERAAERLRAVRGIGPWSASVVLLRGLGRLDAFPLRDSGVARSLRLLSGDPEIDPSALLAALGPVRGMLYFHLLLGRLRNLRPAAPDSCVGNPV